MNITYPDDHYIRYVDACDAHAKGLVYITAIYHDMCDPNDSARSYLVSFDFNNIKAGYNISINENKFIRKRGHVSDTPFCGSDNMFSALCRDLEGNVYIGENYGFIKYDGVNAALVEVKNENGGHHPINCIYSGSDGIFLGDLGGGVIEYKNNKIHREQLNNETIKSDFINGIHGANGSLIVAVGCKGLVAKYMKSQWSIVHSPVNGWVNAVWVANDKEIYIGGDGFAWKWDGDGRWVQLKIKKRMADQNARDIIFENFAWYQNCLYAAASINGIYRLEGDTFVPVTEVGEASVSKLSITGAGLIGLANLWGKGGNWITHFDGRKWTTQEINISL